jgi:hypothetical protein
VIIVNNRFALTVIIAALLQAISFAAPIRLTLEGAPSIAFGEVQPGASKYLPEGGYHIAAKVESSEDGVWNLNIKSDSLLTSGSNTISANNFRWSTWYAGFYKTGGEGVDDWYRHTEGLSYLGTEVAFRDYDTLVYTSGGSDEYPLFSDNNHGIGGYTEVQFQFILEVPYEQPPGTYTTTVTYTVTQ